jgi:hypothetical protein
MRDTLVGEVWAAMDCRTNRKVVVKVYFRHLVSRGRAGGRAGGRARRAAAAGARGEARESALRAERARRVPFG